jgi:PAC2 family
MDHVEFDREPPGNLTTLVVAFGGWIDAGRAATGALRHLASDLGATPLARIDAEEFFVFTLQRPEVRPRHPLATQRVLRVATGQWARRSAAVLGAGAA